MGSSIPHANLHDTFHIEIILPIKIKVIGNIYFFSGAHGHSGNSSTNSLSIMYTTPNSSQCLHILGMIDRGTKRERQVIFVILYF